MAFGTAGSAIRRREQDRCRHQHRNRGGSEFDPGRLYAPVCHGGESYQRNPLQESQVNFMHDIAPVALLAREPGAMVVHPSFPAKSLVEFIAYAKANSGKVTMASGGYGAPSHISG